MTEHVVRVSKAAEAPSAPEAPEWSDAGAEALDLSPVPVEAQPTEYIRVKWADGGYGNIGEVSAAALRDEGHLTVRLEWSGSPAPNGEFPDAAAVYFPDDDDAVASTFGSEDHSVELWYWQENLDQAKRLRGTGPGAFAPSGDGVDAAATLDGDRWSITLRGPVGETPPTRLGVAVWDGSNEERAGLGAVTHDWVALDLQA